MKVLRVLESQTLSEQERSHFIHELNKSCEIPLVLLLRQLIRPRGGADVLFTLRSHIQRVLNSVEDDAGFVKSLKSLVDLFFKEEIFHPSSLRATVLDPSKDFRRVVDSSVRDRVYPSKDIDRILHSVGLNRRVYQLIHPDLSDPLAYLKVAFTPHLASNIQDIFSGSEAQSYDVHQQERFAMFYSISVVQPDLSGYKLGETLIKLAVEDLVSRSEDIHEFSTLSPIPGFRSWLHKTLQDDTWNRLEIPIFARRRLIEASSDAFVRHMRSMNRFNFPSDWTELQPHLLRCCAYYLICCRSSTSGRLLNPVANFHLGNGATCERLNPYGDVSIDGFDRSLCVLVNYQYHLSRLETNKKSSDPDVSEIVSELMMKKS